jgi:YbbR domain-containing protein
VRAALTERLGLKATALLIAMLLWLVVSARQPVEEYVTVRVMPTLDSSLVLLEQPVALRALVTGRAVDIVKLRADPPAVHRLVDADVPDTLVLAVNQSDVRIPPELADHVHVLDVQPRTVALRFGTRATRRVPVEVEPGRILLRRDTTTVAVASVTTEPSTVRITGPRQLVRRVRAMRPFSMTIIEGDTTAHFADLDTTGLGVLVTPARVKVILPR